MESRSRINDKLMRRCREFIVKQEVGFDEAIFSDEGAAWQITEPAFYIARDIFFTSTCSLEGCKRYLPPLAESDPEQTHDFLLSAFVEGIDIGVFHHVALGQTLPGDNIFNGRDLVVTAHGLVASASILFNHTTAQETAMAITLMNGTISKDEIPYERIRENSPRSNAPLSKFETMTMYRRKNKSIAVQLPRPNLPYHFETVVAESNNILELRRYLIWNRERRSDIKGKYDVSWIQAMYAIATAHHLSPAPLSSSLREAIGEKLYSRSVEEPILTIALPCRLPHMSEASRVVMATDEQDPLRIFAAATARDTSPTLCSRLLIRQSGDFLQCLESANQFGNGWTLIC